MSDPVREWQLAKISTEVALARLLLAGRDPAETALAGEAEARAAGVARLRAMLSAAEIAHDGTASPAAVGAMFDRAASISPEAAVAAFCLGDTDRLAAGTAEIVAWLDDQRLLRPGSEVLDFGCGIGRIAGAIAGRVRSVRGLDASGTMVAAARSRVRAENVTFDTVDGRDLRGVADGSVDLVLAVDSFPYVVQAGLGAAMLGEMARVLRPGGACVLLNVAYGEHDLRGWAAAAGLEARVWDAAPFAVWDGRAYRLDKSVGEAWFAAMRAESFAAAHAIADAVLAGRDPATRDDPRRPYHERWVWDGTSPDGRDVLVRCYHGLGDTLQFARFLPALRARARSVTVEAPAPLTRLLPGAVGFDPARPLPEDGRVAVEIMELAHMLRADASGADAAWLGRMRRPADGRIGVCWRAGAWDRARSVSREALLAACAGLDVVELVPGTDVDDDLAATARLIAGLSLVVTVDTMVAHLAGAIGVPTVMLLRRAADWRWGLGARTAWYPRAMLLRQVVEGDWSGALAELAADAAIGPNWDAGA